MSTRLLCLKCAIALSVILAPQNPAARAADEAPIRILVPAYFYPGGDGLADWKRLIESSSKAPIVAIVNPDSGPGKRRDPNYEELFRLAKGKEITLIGYITFSYGERPLSAIKADVDSWLHFYPEIQGIFFDEQASGAEGASFALESFAYAQQKINRGLVVTNPGVLCAKDYFSGKTPPVACVFEHETGFDKYQQPDWARAMGREHFALLLYRVDSADRMRTALKQGIDKGMGYVFFTDATAPMPWGRLPSYWDDEVAEVARLNGKSKR